jgi:hypothetical protein
MATFAFYTDASLTTPVTGSVGIGEGTTNTVFYLGSTNATKKLQNATSPGVDQITVDIVDANPGSGPEDSWVYLALTSGGLDSAVAGASLNLGLTITGGVANARAVWVRIVNSLSGSSSSTDLSIQVSNAKEFAV